MQNAALRRVCDCIVFVSAVTGSDAHTAVAQFSSPRQQAVLQGELGNGFNSYLVTDNISSAVLI